MKHQQVSVDYWAMGKSMLMYGVLTVLGWMMLRLFNAVFTLPRRLRTQQENIQATLQEFQFISRDSVDYLKFSYSNNDAEEEVTNIHPSLRENRPAVSSTEIVCSVAVSLLWECYKRRYPDLNVTEEDLRNAEKELEEWNRELDQKLNSDDVKEQKETAPESGPETIPAVEDKKSI